MVCCNKRFGGGLGLILLLAFALRLAGAFWWQTQLPADAKFGMPDSQSYWSLAGALAAGEPYQLGSDEYRVFRMPGYPAVLATLFLIAGDEPDVVWARVLGAFLGTLAVAAVAWVAWLWFGVRTALVAGLLAAVYPGGIGMSIFVLSEAPFCPLMMLNLGLFYLAVKSTSLARRSVAGGAAGLLAGLATLMRPSWLLFIPFAMGCVLLVEQERGKVLGVFALMLLVLCGTMTPWWIRNYRVAGRFVPTTLQVGASFYDGLNPQATGASDMSEFPFQFYLQQKREDRAASELPQEIFEYRMNQRLKTAAIGWATQHPGKALQLAGVKLGRIWNPLPNDVQSRGSAMSLLVLASYLPILGLALAGAWRFADRQHFCWLLTLPAVYFTLLHMIFVSSIRYRQPAMLALIVLASGFLVSFFSSKQTSLEPQGIAS
ncbi:MAG: glycosyltransferase family 39 protein [Pirellulaceae bacterium]|nr:glycosyltransferase family 39 protein [Pirellulaceae bacterium]